MIAFAKYKNNELSKLEHSADELVVDKEIKDTINEKLETLNPREIKVLSMRFGLNGYKEHTLEEVGIKFDVQRERIRQIEAKALRKLRHPSRSDDLAKLINL